MAPPILPSLKGLTYPAKRYPIWRTLHQEAVSGQNNPIPLWSFPRWRYELVYSAMFSGAAAFQGLPAIELQALAAFFNIVNGSATVFQYTDPDDGAVTDQLFGTGDGSTVAFALTRTMTGAGSVTFNEPVFAPTITNIKISGTPTSAYTLGTQGLVTFNSAPAAAAALTWTGTFNWLCRFDEDTAQFEKFMNNLWELKTLKFTTIKTQSK
jgi:uncharacterized protein (TIGR02217 family)